MSHKATPEQKLKRFLYLSTEDSLFVSGDPEFHKYYTNEKFTCASELLRTSDDPADSVRVTTFVRNIFTSAANDPLLPAKEALYFAFAKLITHEYVTEVQRFDLYSFLPHIIKTTDDLFNFIKFVSKVKRPFCSGIQHVVNKYYMSKDSMELIRCICESNGYHGWTHKDIFKLSHISTKSDEVKEIIVKYVMYGEKKATEAAAENKNALEVLEYARKIKEYRNCTDEEKVAEFVKELNIDHVWQLPPAYMKSAVVWAALIPNLSLSELLAFLPKLFRTSMLKHSVALSKVLEMLENKELVESSKIHPIEIFIGMKNFEKGGKPRDPQLIKYLESKEETESKISANPEYRKPNFAHQEPFKCPSILTSIQKALSFSYGNIQVVIKRVMITINTNDQMMIERCLTTKNINCFEAAAMLALCIAKSSDNFTVAVFNGDTVTPVLIEKGNSIGQVIKKIKEADRGSVIWSAPFNWAAEGNKVFDLFVHIGVRPNILDMSKEEAQKDKPKEAFSNYMKKMNKPYAKFITHSLAVHSSRFSDGDTNILDICGFDKNIPKVINAFYKNMF